MFEVGKKVVCITDKEFPIKRLGLVKDEIYTVLDVKICTCGKAAFLDVGIIPPTPYFTVGHVPCNYFIDCKGIMWCIDDWFRSVDYNFGEEVEKNLIPASVEEMIEHTWKRWTRKPSPLELMDITWRAPNL